MALEDVVLWMAFIGGVFGAVSFVWHVYNHYVGREEAEHRSLNTKVLRPWGELKIQHKWGQGEANAIALVVPKVAFPPDVAPTTGQDGLEVHQLPGLERGIAFLRRRHPKAHERWQTVERLWRRYEDLLSRRRAFVEPWIRQQMEKEFPKLLPARLSWTENDTYVPSNLMAYVEGRGYDVAHLGERAQPPRVSKSPIHSSSSVYYELRGADPAGTLVCTGDESLADVDAMYRVIASCMQRPEFRKVNKDLAACFEELDEAVEAFRSELREVATAVDVEGR